MPRRGVGHTGPADEEGEDGEDAKIKIVNKAVKNLLRNSVFLTNS